MGEAALEPEVEEPVDLLEDALVAVAPAVQEVAQAEQQAMQAELAVVQAELEACFDLVEVVDLKDERG